MRPGGPAGGGREGEETQDGEGSEAVPAVFIEGLRRSGWHMRPSGQAGGRKRGGEEKQKGEGSVGVTGCVEGSLIPQPRCRVMRPLFLCDRFRLVFGCSSVGDVDTISNGCGAESSVGVLATSECSGEGERENGNGCVWLSLHEGWWRKTQRVDRRNGAIG